MFTLRRWWDRHGVRIGLTGLVIAAAWFLRQSQGLPVLEVYQLLSRPFQGSPPQQEDILGSAQIQELQQRLSELESQNQQLRELLDYAAELPEGHVFAPVIGRSSDHWWQQLTLGRGSRDGIEPGAIVSGTGGIVGRVVQVTPNTSRVLLISDPSSQVGVTVARSRAMGYMRGQSQNRATMEFFDKVPDVRPGDAVSTSVFSQLFPPGLAVGYVESINLVKTPAPEAVIRLSAPISSLEWVVIVPNPKAQALLEEEETDQTQSNGRLPTGENNP
jgi:rod shape-determining protein MreC